MIEVDVRGLSCPIPIVKTRKAIKENPRETLYVLVETETSKENVFRLAEGMKYKVKIEKISDGYNLILIPPKK